MQHAAIAIRKAVLADLDEILRHRRDMFWHMGYTDAAALDAMQTSSRPFIARGLAEGWYHGWLAVTASGKAVAGGGVIVSDWASHPSAPHQARRAYILNVYTDPECRRQGMARQILQLIIDWGRREGFSTLWLHASEYGRPLYEELGFKPTNEMKLALG